MTRNLFVNQAKSDSQQMPEEKNHEILYLTFKWNNKQTICILRVPKHSFKTIYSLPKQLLKRKKLLCNKFQFFHILSKKIINKQNIFHSFFRSFCPRVLKLSKKLL